MNHKTKHQVKQSTENIEKKERDYIPTKKNKGFMAVIHFPSSPSSCLQLSLSLVTSLKLSSFLSYISMLIFFSCNSLFLSRNPAAQATTWFSLKLPFFYPNLPPEFTLSSFPLPQATKTPPPPSLTASESSHARVTLSLHSQPTTMIPQWPLLRQHVTF